MAYIKFCVIAVETSLRDQSVYITFNKEVDSDSLNYQNIILACNNLVTSPLAAYDIILGKDLKTLCLKFIDSPVVNQPYVLVLQDKILDLEGNNLDKSLFRNVTFKSSVTSSITINSPANFEVITSQTFSWTETGDNLVNSYRLQVSTDTGFHNLEVNSLIKDQTSVTLGAPLKVGQHFFRVRAEQDDMFGIWSEIYTFLIQEVSGHEEKPTDGSSVVENEDVTVEDLVGDILDDKLTLLEQPSNGITPASFSFLFSDNLDPSDIKISVIRSDF